ncbi:MAG: class I SAM-dependent methyltransferase [Gemmatimonadota bacterium]|nr:class I SAM-dependent methyltransferase [Gemmatimonadota bacterium]
MSTSIERTFKDHFSSHAASYAAYRPRYPVALFHWLAVVAPGTVQAWDAGTGNGQVALGLVTRFSRVRATDASAEQIAQAVPHPRISYAVAQYESGLEGRSADLVTAGQALHWFDADAFCGEACRVLRPGGILAVFGYKYSTVAPEVDELVRHHLEMRLGQYWPPEHRTINDEYRGIALPIDELVPPPLELREDWSLAQYIGFLRTWSGTRRFIEARGEEPILEFERALTEAWGASTRRAVRWELFVRAGEVR